MRLFESWTEFLDASLFTVAQRRISVFRKVYAEGAMAAGKRIRELAASGMAYKTVVAQVEDEASDLRLGMGYKTMLDAVEEEGEKDFHRAGPIFGPTEGM